MTMTDVGCPKERRGQVQEVLQEGRRRRRRRRRSYGVMMMMSVLMTQLMLPPWLQPWCSLRA